MGRLFKVYVTVTECQISAMQDGNGLGFRLQRLRLVIAMLQSCNGSHAYEVMTDHGIEVRQE